jgi:hypothetical protein
MDNLKINELKTNTGKFGVNWPHWESIERRIWITEESKVIAAAKVESKFEAYKAAIAKAAVGRACISSKTQREEKFNYGYRVQLYDNLAVIDPVSTINPGSVPPGRAGEVIQQFTKRSAARMMQKMRKLNKSSLPVPYFVTLTYHKNMIDCKVAKRHLNTFLQRYRRKYGSEFSYIWKLEAQKRGAVHYHLAMFIPKQDLNKLQQAIGRQWAEVTADIDGVQVEYSSLGRYQKKARRFSGSEIKRHNVPDFEHEKYGTNVRECNNWKMFIGYVGAYMKKEVKPFPFVDPETGEYSEPGRFWGTSNNFDFSAISTQIIPAEKVEEYKKIANDINDAAYNDFLQYAGAQAGRLSTWDNKKAAGLKMLILQRTCEKMKARYLINKEKIMRLMSLQFEIPYIESYKQALKISQGIEASELYNNRTLIHVYKYNPKLCEV